MSSARDVSGQVDIGKYKNSGDGAFKRAPSSFRDAISAASGSKYAPESGRYHLYVSYACPWATRTLIVRKLKGLEQHIGVTVVSPRMGSNGWPLGDVDPFPGAQKDPLEGAQHIKDLYLKVAPDYAGRCAEVGVADDQALIARADLPYRCSGTPRRRAS